MLLRACLLLLAAAVASTDANCKMHDAKWIGTKQPVISQPSRTDPSKVMLNWKKVMKNPRCVDEYTIWSWKQGQDRRQARKIQIANPGEAKVSHVVNVEPCVPYNFEIEFLEKDWTGSDKEVCKRAFHTTQAVPRFTSKSKNDYVVGYYFDQARGLHDLGKVSVRFNKSVLKNPSCVKQIEISGREVATPSRQRSASFGGSGSRSAAGRSSSLSRSNSINSYGGYYQGVSSSGGSGRYSGSSGTGGSGSYSSGQSSVGGRGSYSSAVSGRGSGHGGSGGYSSGSSSTGGSGSYSSGSSSAGGSGSYNSGYPSAGGSGGYNSGNPSAGGSGGYNSGYPSAGGSGGYNSGYPSTGGSGGYNAGYPSTGGSGGYNSGSVGGRGGHSGSHGTGSSGSYPGNHDHGLPGHVHTQGRHQERYKRMATAARRTTKRPSRKTTTARPAARQTQLAAKLLPPYLNDTIEIVADIPKCSAYELTLKVVLTNGKTLGEITGLKLAHISQLADYHPPPLSKVFKVERPVGGAVNTRPVISLQPNMGVPADCLPEFFRSVDRHMDDLERDLAFHLRQESRATDNTRRLSNQLDMQKSKELKQQFGCVCNATTVVVNTTSAKYFKKTREVYGAYEFGGMQNGKPYFKQVSLDVPLPQNRTTARPAHRGSRNRREQAPSGAEGAMKVHYLYWEPTKLKTWVIGPKMDGKNVMFRSKEVLAKCPSDPLAKKKWQYSGTLSWKDEKDMEVLCGRQQHRHQHQQRGRH